MSEKANWISVDELSHGFGANNLDNVNDLAGKSFNFNFENGWVIKHDFITESELNWTIQSNEKTYTESYTCVNPRSGIYFIDFEKKSEAGTTVSLALDLNKGVATAVISVMPSREEIERPILYRALSGENLRAVKVDFARATVDREFTADDQAIHPETDELLNWRVEYSYTDDEVYEHIYLRQNAYTWNCLKGNEVGLCDTDYCSYRKVAEDLYLFVWEEKIIPTVGVLLVDFQAMRTCGKIVGYQGEDTDQLSNFQVGAKALKLNATAYPCLQK
nr:MoaF C-terminal domain-containing protein [uncultured Amphritea sp.]